MYNPKMSNPKMSNPIMSNIFVRIPRMSNTLINQYQEVNFDQLAFEWWKQYKQPCMLGVVSFTYSTMEFVTNLFYGMAAGLHSTDNIPKLNPLSTTDDNLRHLCELETIYVDGTFQICPTLFTQLFTIDYQLNISHLPLNFFLSDTLFISLLLSNMKSTVDLINTFQTFWERA